MTKYFAWITVWATTRSGYMMTSPTFAKWRPRRETRGKVTSRLFAATRSVFSPCYFESCDFRQGEIRGVKKKCRPMNVCAFSGGRTTEHESFSAQKNAGQGAKHLKKEGEFQFSDPWCSAWQIQIVLCFGRCNSQLRRTRAGFNCNAMFILCCLAVGWKSKSTLFLWQKDAAGLFVENRNHGLAWSQSGNKKAVQTLLSLFKSSSQKTRIYRKTPSWSLLSQNAFLHSLCSFSLEAAL